MTKIVIKELAVDKLVPYINNSRTHSEEQIAQVASSIKEFGFLNPIITDGEQGIIAGHCRVLAAKHLGINKVPCIEASYLTEQQKRAYILADNRLALNAGWDEQALRVELEALNLADFNMDLLGFTDKELEYYVDNDLNFAPGNEDEQGKLDELDSDQPKLCPHCGGEL